MPEKRLTAEEVKTRLRNCIPAKSMMICVLKDPRAPGTDGYIGCFDPRQAAVASDPRQQGVIDRWVAKTAGEEIGFPIEIVRRAFTRGHDIWWFKILREGREKEVQVLKVNMEKIHANLARSFSPGDFKPRLEPDLNVPGSDGFAVWRDDDGLTAGNSTAEKQVINGWISSLLSAKLGSSIICMKVRYNSGDGTTTMWFRRI